MSSERVPVRNVAPEIRKKSFTEVCLGYNEEEAVLEASRCLHCKNPLCMSACPVQIRIPEFIECVKQRKIREAYEVIYDSSVLPAICGRVCPQETQCEGKCVLGMKGQAISIGKLERFVADANREAGYSAKSKIKENGKKIAVVGSGPAGLSAAGALRKKGYEVTVFEALHLPGGVLTYGIPEFRLPKAIVQKEIDQLKQSGVIFQTDVLIGKTRKIDRLWEQGYQAIYLATGAGLPMFMGIPGENGNEVFSANEFLVRANLMKGYSEQSMTPVPVQKECIVVGGGNVAMDAARTALRFGMKTHIVYRRSEKELPARKEEVEHAKEEGIEFHLLENPIEILLDSDGHVTAVRNIRMELGEPDASGRRRPVEIKGSEYILPCDMVIMALGTRPNPLVKENTEGLDTDAKGRILVTDTDETSIPNVFAGGDAVTGSATVILAMQAGLKAAEEIDRKLSHAESK